MVQGCLGIGLALVAGPVLIAIDADFAPGPLLLAGQIVGVRHAVMERRHVDRVALRRCLIGLPVGLGLGLAFLVMVSDRTLALLVGGFTAVAAVALLSGFSVRRRTATDVAAGGGVAFASVTAGLPGPPLVVAFNDMPPATMRGTASSFILAVAVVGMVGLVAAGEFGTKEWELTASMLPGVMMGMLAARFVRPFLDRSWFRPAVLVVALVGALALIARQLT